MTSRKRIAGPDMICVGLPKAGTGWLYDQLAGHPDFWMPPIKEISYFLSRPLRPGLDKPLEIFRKTGRLPKERLSKRIGRELSERDVDFFKRYATITDESSVEDYATLFDSKDELLSGDISPLYGAIKQAKANRIAERFPDTKVVLLLRDPVERAWSHWRMAIDRLTVERSKAANKNPITLDSVQSVPKFRRFIENPNMASRSMPSAVVRRWSTAFGDRFRYFFLDDISLRPEETRLKILTFLGADATKPSAVPPTQNSKARPAVGRSPEIQAVMQEVFAEERSRCAAQFGGPALAWVDAPF